MYSFIARALRRLSTSLEKSKRQKKDKPVIERDCIVSYRAELHTVERAGAKTVRIKRLDSDLTLTVPCDSVDVVDYPYYQ